MWFELPLAKLGDPGCLHIILREPLPPAPPGRVKAGSGAAWQAADTVG